MDTKFQVLGYWSVKTNVYGTKQVLPDNTKVWHNESSRNIPYAWQLLEEENKGRLRKYITQSEEHVFIIIHQSDAAVMA